MSRKEETGKLERIGRKVLYEGSALTFCRDDVILPDGTTEKWDFVHHNRGGGACCVPVLSDGRILMIRQPRPAVDRSFLELPAGARTDAEEDPKAAAARELEEETGYTAGRLTFLAEIMTAPAWCDEKTVIYLAEDLTAAGGQHLDPAEAIDLVPMELPALLASIREGTLTDAKTVCGLLAYAAMITN